ncbi:hypothetical protein CSKR_109256, partial [Clonorchis sinensis]
WLEREFIDRKVRGSNPTSASRLPLCLGLGNLAVSQPSCFLPVAWQLDTERVLQLNDFFIFLFPAIFFVSILSILFSSSGTRPLDLLSKQQNHPSLRFLANPSALVTKVKEEKTFLSRQVLTRSNRIPGISVLYKCQSATIHLQNHAFSETRSRKTLHRNEKVLSHSPANIRFQINNKLANSATSFLLVDIQLLVSSIVFRSYDEATVQQNAEHKPTSLRLGTTNTSASATALHLPEGKEVLSVPSTGHPQMDCE